MNMRGYERAQAVYDAMTPPDDGPQECPDCVRGWRCTTDDAENEHEIKCETCNGFGWIDENGEPHDPDAAERDACDYYDRLKDEQLTGD
jgi:hypothetical protein